MRRIQMLFYVTSLGIRDQFNQFIRLFDNSFQQIELIELIRQISTKTLIVI